MSDIAHSLVRRAVDVTQQQYANNQPASDDSVPKLALWGLLLLWVTFIIYMAVVSAISYTYGDVIATLAMIETPTATAYAAESDPASAKAPLLSEENKDEQASKVDFFVVENLPVTRTLRSAVKHLVSTAGTFARFRGLPLAIVYHGLHSIIVSFIAPFRSHLFRPLVSIAISVLLCRLHITWTHVVISMPSSKHWWQRIPPRKVFRHLVLPTAIWATAQHLCLYLPAALFGTAYSNLQNPHAYGSNPTVVQKVALIQVIMTMFVFIATILLIVLPAEVMLKRVEASLLPEEDESIVSFDRTFQGKVRPESMGGTGAVSMLDAWRTFGKEGRIRLLKLYGKVLAILVTVGIMFGMLMVGELKMITGGDFEKLVEAARKSFKGEL